jgi:hypothetical protein
MENHKTQMCSNFKENRAQEIHNNPSVKFYWKIKKSTEVEVSGGGGSSSGGVVRRVKKKN